MLAVISSLSQSLLGVPLRGLSKSFALLLIDFVEGVIGHPSGLGVCHTENIICLNPSVDSAVSRNWLSQLLDFFGLIHLVDAVESCQGCVLGLHFDLSCLGSEQSLVV